MAREAFLSVGSGKALGVSQLLRESLKIPGRNRDLAASVVLLLIFPCVLLNLSHDLAMGRWINALVDDDPDENPPETRRNLGLFLILESVFFLAWCLLSFLAMSLTIYASSMTYTGRHLSLKETVLKITVFWKKLARTWISVAVITMAYAFLLSTMAKTFSSLIKSGDAWYVWISFMGSLAALFYANLAVIWMLSFAISIMEESFSGMNAIRRAFKLIQGKKLHGFLLMVLLFLLSFPIIVLLYVNTCEDDQGMVVRVAVGSTCAAMACVMKIFSYMVFTVYYYQCRKEHGEGVEVDGNEGFCLLTNIVHVDNSLP